MTLILRHKLFILNVHWREHTSLYEAKIQLYGVLHFLRFPTLMFWGKLLDVDLLSCKERRGIKGQ